MIPAPESPRWEDYTHEQLFAMSRGAAARAGQDAGAAWAAIGDELVVIEQDLARAIREVGAHWEGAAADALTASTTPLGRWALEAVGRSHAIHMALRDQTDYALYTTHTMPPPADRAATPLDLDGGLEHRRQAEGEVRARELMAAYQANSERTTTPLLWWEPVPRVVAASAAEGGSAPGRTALDAGVGAIAGASGVQAPQAGAAVGPGGIAAALGPGGALPGAGGANPVTGGVAGGVGPGGSGPGWAAGANGAAAAGSGPAGVGAGGVGTGLGGGAGGRVGGSGTTRGAGVVPGGVGPSGAAPSGGAAGNGAAPGAGRPGAAGPAGLDPWRPTRPGAPPGTTPPDRSGAAPGGTAGRIPTGAGPVPGAGPSGSGAPRLFGSPQGPPTSEGWRDVVRRYGGLTEPGAGGGGAGGGRGNPVTEPVPPRGAGPSTGDPGQRPAARPGPTTVAGHPGMMPMGAGTGADNGSTHRRAPYLVEDTGVFDVEPYWVPAILLPYDHPDAEWYGKPRDRT